MDSVELIERLVQREQPGKFLSIGSRLLAWSGIVVITAILGLLFGKYEIVQIFDNVGTYRLFRTLSLLIVAFLVGFAAILHSVGFTSSVALRAIGRYSMIATFLLASLLFLEELFYTENPFGGQALKCTGVLVLYSITPLLFLGSLLQGLSPSSSRVAAALCFIASGVLGAVFLEFSCTIEDPRHVFVYHLLPLVLFGTLGMLCGRLVFSLDRRIAHLRRKLEREK